MEELFDQFNIRDQSYTNELKKHLAINQGDLNTEFSEHASLFAWYATAYEMAVMYESELKEELHRLYAHADSRVRNEAKQAQVKLTEKMVENTVITSPEYVELNNSYLEAKKQSGLLKVARDAMIHRRDMLVQMGANYRAEGMSGVTLNQ